MPDPSLAFFDTWQPVLESAPRWITGLVGGLLLLAGGRMYKLAVLTPGILAGVTLAMLLPPTLGPLVIAGAALLLALVGALLCHLLERLAVHAIGAIALAGLCQVGWPLVAAEPAPWWGVLLAAALGLLLFPRIFKSLIRWVTALVGALVLAWTIGRPDDPFVIGGLFLGGCAVQALSGGRRETRKNDDD